MNIGAHPAIAFKIVPAVPEGVSKEKETLVAKHYVAGELSPNYMLSKKISIGIYYLYAHGFESDVIKSTHFVTLNANLSNMKLTDQLVMRFTPQFYYLKMDDNDGFYFTSALTLSKKNFPLWGTHFAANQKFS